MERLKERIEVAFRALITLEQVLQESAPRKVVRDAAIQRFEYPRRAASPSYRRKPVSRGPDWIPPYQVRGRRVKHGMTGQNRRRYPAARCEVGHYTVEAAWKAAQRTPNMPV